MAYERISETMSSNWRELANLVESVEVEVRDRGLSDTEIFLFTDNTTAEAAYWKGGSKSEKTVRPHLASLLARNERRPDSSCHSRHWDSNDGSGHRWYFSRRQVYGSNAWYSYGRLLSFA